MKLVRCFVIVQIFQNCSAFFIAQAVTEHADAWPFKDPVDAREVPDYYDIIKDPIGTCHVVTSLFCGVTVNSLWHMDVIIRLTVVLIQI